MVKRFLNRRKVGLCLLLLVTILLCNTVQIHLDIREHQRLTAQFAIIPPYQPETVWCTENGDLILLYTEHARMGAGAERPRLFLLSKERYPSGGRLS